METQENTRESFRQSRRRDFVIDRVARHYKVSYRRVIHTGQAGHSDAWRVVCGEHYSPPYAYTDEDSATLSLMVIVDLKPTLKVQHSDYPPASVIVLTGQCQECGAVLVAEYTRRNHDA